MYEIAKTGRFEAAHIIRDHKDPVTGGPGKCSQLHGHSYEFTVVLRGYKLQEIGFLVDYYHVGQFIKEIEKDYDHKFLNDLPEYSVPHNATAEQMAFEIYNRAEIFFEDHCGPIMEETLTGIYYVEVKETASTYARFYNPSLVG